MRVMRKFVFRGAALVILVYLILLAALFIKQRDLLYPLKAEIADIAAAGNFKA